MEDIISILVTGAILYILYKLSFLGSLENIELNLNKTNDTLEEIRHDLDKSNDHLAEIEQDISRITNFCGSELTDSGVNDLLGKINEKLEQIDKKLGSIDSNSDSIRDNTDN